MTRVPGKLSPALDGNQAAESGTGEREVGPQGPCGAAGTKTAWHGPSPTKSEIH